MRWRAWVVAAGALVMAAMGCAAAPPRAAAPALTYHTFAIRPGRIVEPGGDLTSLRERLDGRLGQELEQKGLRPDETRPDLIVTYTAGATARLEPEGTESGQDWDVGPAMVLPAYDERREATLAVALIDTSTRQVVWQSAARAAADDLDGAVAKVVRRALHEYPLDVY
jgi:hypothetical protein